MKIKSLSYRLSLAHLIKAFNYKIPMLKSKTFLTVCLSLLIASCNFDCISIQGEGPIVERSNKVESFNSIDLNIPASAIVNQSESYSVIAYGQSNILDEIIYEVVNENLTIKFEKNCLNTSYDSLSVYITIPTLKSLQINGSGDAIITNNFECDKLNIGISGSGSINASVVANTLTSNISGSGNIELSGKAKNADHKISGSGEIHAFYFDTDKSEIIISGSGDAELFANKNLDATISGSGDVKYIGNPKISSSISGSGEVSEAK